MNGIELDTGSWWGKSDRLAIEELLPDETLRQRFLRAGNKYYFRDQDDNLAFEDQGNRIVTSHDDPMVATAMVHMANAKGWRFLKLDGSAEFRREVWLQASLKGMHVRGYEPTDSDLQTLVISAVQTAMRRRGDSERAIEMATALATERLHVLTETGNKVRSSQPLDTGLLWERG